MSEHVGRITIDLTKQLAESLDGHLELLRHTLRSIEDGSYGQHRNTRPQIGSPVFQVSEHLDVSAIARDAIRGTYLSIMRSFVDFIDLLLGIKELQATPLTVTRELRSVEEATQFISEQAARQAQRVGARVRESAPQKVARIGGLSSNLKSAVEDYFAIRRTLEHHKNVAQKDMVLRTYRMELIVDGTTVIEAFPIHVDQGQTLTVQVREQVHSFQAGEEIVLSETELDELVVTIRTVIVPELIKALAPTNS